MPSPLANLATWLLLRVFAGDAQGMYANYGGSFQPQILRPYTRLTFLTLGLCLHGGAKTTSQSAV